MVSKLHKVVYKGVFYGLCRVILGVLTLAHVLIQEFPATGTDCKRA